MQALSTKRDRPWRVTRHALVHAAIYLQLAWFSSELVLGSTMVALAPQILGALPQHLAHASSSLYHCTVLVAWVAVGEVRQSRAVCGIDMLID